MLFTLPDWLIPWLGQHRRILADDTAKMEWLAAIAAENVRQQTGGPFAAAVFEHHTQRLLSIGVNQVMTLNSCLAHAEIVAIARIQHFAQRFDLSPRACDCGKQTDNKHHHSPYTDPYFPICTLFSTAQPCAMCLGAITWSGIQHVIFGATRQDVETLTDFDEGPVHPQWSTALRQRGIEVHGPVAQTACCAVLQDYQRRGQPNYSPQRNLS